MATSNIRNPDDASNTGPREATRTNTEDSVTKHWPRVLMELNRYRVTDGGIFYVHSGAQVVQAAAHGAGAGFLWIVQHTGATQLLAVRRVHFRCQLGSALATPTSPRIAIERFTTTTNPSGTQITAARRRSGEAPSANWSARSTNAGLTQTAGAMAHAFMPQGSNTAVGGNAPAVDKWDPPADEQIILAAGEGIRVYQPDAGTTADTRRFVLDVTLEEFTEF